MKFVTTLMFTILSASAVFAGDDGASVKKEGGSLIISQGQLSYSYSCKGKIDGAELVLVPSESGMAGPSFVAYTEGSSLSMYFSSFDIVELAVVSKGQDKIEHPSFVGKESTVSAQLGNSSIECTRKSL